jgi:hypothetical protein
MNCAGTAKGRCFVAYPREGELAGRYRRDLSTIRGMFSMLCRKAARCALSRLGARSLVTLKEYFWELDARPLPPASKME